jgi:hypothetical protein
MLLDSRAYKIFTNYPPLAYIIVKGCDYMPTQQESLEEVLQKFLISDTMINGYKVTVDKDFNVVAKVGVNVYDKKLALWYTSSVMTYFLLQSYVFVPVESIKISVHFSDLLLLETVIKSMN